jgi:hypothetical protein
MNRELSGRTAIRFTASLIATAIITAGNTSAAAISPEGFELSGFAAKVDNLPVTGALLKATTGQTVSIEFNLKNTTDRNIALSPQFGAFIGARVNDKNMDFGHQSRGTNIKAGTTVFFKGSRILSEAGKWVFWPAYNVNGRWGPFKWQTLEISASSQSVQQPTAAVQAVNAVPAAPVSTSSQAGFNTGSVPLKIDLSYYRGSKAVVNFAHLPSHAGPDKSCAACHHKPKDNKATVKCSECHKQETQNNVPDFKTAFHNRCKTCHTQILSQQPSTAAPTKCNECHK